MATYRAELNPNNLDDLGGPPLAGFVVLRPKTPTAAGGGGGRQMPAAGKGITTAGKSKFMRR